MNAKDVIKQNLDLSHHVTCTYLEDLSDADLMGRPVAAMNHIAWQLGHQICATRSMVAELGHAMPDVPAGFEDAHSPEAAGSNDASEFATKSEYLALAKKMHDATLAALDATPDADLDRPAPESMRSYAPTVGAVLAMVGLHTMMHAGQYVAVRRQLGKPVVI